MSPFHRGSDLQKYWFQRQEDQWGMGGREKERVSRGNNFSWWENLVSTQTGPLFRVRWVRSSSRQDLGVEREPSKTQSWALFSAASPGCGSHNQ